MCRHLLLAAALLALAQPAAVPRALADSPCPKIYDGMTAEEAAFLIREAGYKAQVKVDADNVTYIESKAGNTAYTLVFYGCSGEPKRCLQLDFRALFIGTTTAQQAAAEAFEKDKVFGRAFSTGDKVFLEHPMHLNGGITGANFTNNLELWINILEGFRKGVGI